MSLKIRPLASGSKGNSILVQNEGANLLIDCGISVSEIKKRLSQVALEISDIDLVLITHEHIDHIRSAKALSNTYNIPVYLQEKTHCAVFKNEEPANNIQIIRENFEFKAAGLNIYPFKISHDVATVGYTIQDGDSKFTYATDLGYVDTELIDLAKNSDIVFIESNYDEDMLFRGRYPYYLKKRISSNKGHLSNNDCARAICEIASNGTNNFFLGHLSEENNIPKLALKYVYEAIRGTNCNIEIALQHSISNQLK